MIKFGSCFELAFRRSLFSLILLIIYLIISTIFLSLIGQFEILKNEKNICKGKRIYLEFERNELINTLWANSLSIKTESEWKQLANSKFDFYEKIILSTKISNNYCQNNLILPKTHNWDFISTLRSIFLIITTIGESSSSSSSSYSLSLKQFNGIFIKLFIILILLIGIPLLLIHLENSIKTIFAFCENNFKKPNLIIICFYFGIILIITLILNKKEEEEKEKENFKNYFDIFFSLILLSFTIFEDLIILNKISIWLFLPLFLIIFSLNGCILKYLIKLIHNFIASYEFNFANKFYGKIERAVSGINIINIEEINNNNNKEELNFNKKLENSENISTYFSIGESNEEEEEEEEEEINLNNNSNTTNQIFSAILRKKSISTIAEEEGELLNNNSQ